MSDPTSIGIFLPNWLGDLVMATPALRALRGHFGRQSRIVGIVRPNLIELLAGTDWLDEQWAFDPRAEDPKVRRRALVRRMRPERFDLVILLTNSLDTALVAWRSGAKRRVGYVHYCRGPLLTDRLFKRRVKGRVVPSPMVETYLRLAETVGCPPESPRLELATTESEQRLAEQIWRRLGLRTDGRVIVLNSSGAYGAAKLWPADRFAELSRRVVDQLDHDVLVVCGPDERGTAREIVRRADRPRVFSLADQPLGLATSKACIQRSRLMVSTDSGPRHLAAAFGKPVITLLGPTRPAWIENPTVRAVFVSVYMDCLGCAKRVCPLGHHRCMRDLPPETVYAEVAKLLGEDHRVQAA
ncbi:MAG: lipopolysaccharide heptosyltransferase II [Planctomycetota bacterium]|jgi:heptosyltransferase-2